MHRDFNRLAQSQKREPNEELYSCIYQKFEVPAGLGRSHSDLLMTTMQCKDAIKPSRGDFVRGFSLGSSRRDKEHSKLEQNLARTIPHESSAEPGCGEQQKGVIVTEGYETHRGAATDYEEEAAISSFLMGAKSPRDEESFFGSDLLVTELQKSPDALEEMESRVQVKLMVGEAVLKGILAAMERDATEAVEAKEVELRNVRDQLQEKESILNRLISTLQNKEDEMAKLFDESIRKERRLVLSMLTERERVLAKAKESEQFVAIKQEELLKMAENMVRLAESFDEGSKQVEELKMQIREFMVSKGTYVKVMMEKSEQFRSQDSAVEMIRNEGWFKGSFGVEEDKLPRDQMQRFRHLEIAELQLRELLQSHKEEVSQLMRSNKDDSVLLKKRKFENNGAADELDSRQKIKSTHGDMELLKDRILELIFDNSILVNELSSQKADLGAMVNDPQLQEHGLQAEAVHNNHIESTSDQHLQEFMRMKATLQDYVETAQSLKTKLEEQSWMHEIETGLIIETLKGKVLDLIGEIRLLEEDDSAGNLKDRKLPGSRMLPKSYTGPSILQFSKSEFQHSVNKLNAVTRDFKGILEEKGKSKSDGEQQISRYTENGTSHPTGQLHEEQPYLQKHNYHSVEGASPEESMKRQKVSEENAEVLREARTRISFLEQELAVKGSLLQTCNIEMEEQSGRFELEEELLSTYVEESFRNFLKQTVEIQANLFDVGQKLVSGQNELEAAQDELMRCKAEVDTLKSAAGASFIFADKLQDGASSYVSELEPVRVELQDVRSGSDSELVGFKEEQKEIISRTKELEEKLLQKSDEVVEILQKLDESDWKSQTQTAIILGLVEGSTQECAVEFARLREELKLKHEEVFYLRSEVEEQNERLNSYVNEVSELTTALVSKDHELLVFRQEAELTSSMQRDALLREQENVRAALKEIEDQKKVKGVLVARIEEEKQRVQQLEEALVEQNWKNEVELQMVATIFWEAKPDTSAAWNKERAVAPPGEAQSNHRMAGESPNNKECSRHRCHEYGPDGLIVESSSHGVPVRLAGTKSGAPDMISSLTVQAEKRFSLLERQNSELRRENEKLLEQKTDEVYRLKRECYKEVERIKKEWKECGWNDEKSSSAMKTSLQGDGVKGRDEWSSLDVPTKMSDAVEKERPYASSNVSLVENLAVLERERSRLNSVHQREKEKIIAYYKKLLEEKNTALNGALEEVEGNRKRIGKSEVECSQWKEEVEVLRTEIHIIRKHFASDFEQMQNFMASYEQLENRASHKINQYNIRLEAAQGHVNHLLRQYRALPLSEAEYLQTVQNLQKAETEVDMLGDEVDGLMDTLEKVYSVLNHYSPIIQHYPGLAELVKVVREQILQRLCDSKER